jgi:CO/xanthine dehydrogenase Mo-binding subunit
MTSAGQIGGGMAQALGFTLTEEMRFDLKGQRINPNFSSHHIPRAQELPHMDMVFVQTDELSGPICRQWHL